jgi:hypothetical protein
VDNYKVVLNSDLENVFEILNPIYCVPQKKIEKALKYYSENKK